MSPAASTTIWRPINVQAACGERRHRLRCFLSLYDLLLVGATLLFPTKQEITIHIRGRRRRFFAVRRQSLHPCLSDVIWILFPADAVMFFTSTRQVEAYSTSQGREELGRLRHLIGTYGEKRLPGGQLALWRRSPTAENSRRTGVGRVAFSCLTCTRVARSPVWSVGRLMGAPCDDGGVLFPASSTYVCSQCMYVVYAFCFFSGWPGYRCSLVF